ncbi:hypothetical protein LJC22_06790, partial [Desulfosarcina sp. OttesenSCG-928-G10]|nr:hypothetical protein [Desulfosarcina sp. OttesenSCG-928-G10]
MRDPMAGEAGDTISINKSDSGTWYLGGENKFTSGTGGKTTFTVSGGTLHLYRADEVNNPTTTNSNAMVTTGTISLDGSGSSFTLGSGATLSLGGVGHEIKVGGGTAGTITIAGGATLVFNMAGATTSTVNLTLSAGSITVGGTASFTTRVDLNVTGLSAGTYSLIDYASLSISARDITLGSVTGLGAGLSGTLTPGDTKLTYTIAEVADPTDPDGNTVRTVVGAENENLSDDDKTRFRSGDGMIFVNNSSNSSV